MLCKLWSMQLLLLWTEACFGPMLAAIQAWQSHQGHGLMHFGAWDQLLKQPWDEHLDTVPPELPTAVWWAVAVVALRGRAGGASGSERTGLGGLSGPGRASTSKLVPIVLSKCGACVRVVRERARDPCSGAYSS